MGPETLLGHPEKQTGWNSAPRDKKSPRRSGTSGAKAGLSKPTVVMWFIGSASSRRENCWSACRLSASWRKVCRRGPGQRADPVRPTAHYTMGGIETDQRCETRIKGLFAVVSSSVGLHMALTASVPTSWRNWWSSVVWPGKKRLSTHRKHTLPTVMLSMPAPLTLKTILKALMNQKGSENWAKLRDEMGEAMKKAAVSTAHRN